MFLAAQYEQAYLITEEDVDAIARMSGYDTQMLKNNLGWVVIVSYRQYYPKWSIVPRRVFDDAAKGTSINFSKPIPVH